MYIWYNIVILGLILISILSFFKGLKVLISKTGKATKNFMTSIFCLIISFIAIIVIPTSIATTSDFWSELFNNLQRLF